MARRHSLERLFETEANSAGFEVKQPKSIRIDSAVKNSNGKKGKVVTTPDFFVINPEDGSSVHVELVNGRGNGDHKAAQRRVVEKAGVKNYVQLTGYDVVMIQKAETITEKKSLLLKMLYWMFCI